MRTTKVTFEGLKNLEMCFFYFYLMSSTLTCTICHENITITIILWNKDEWPLELAENKYWCTLQTNQLPVDIKRNKIIITGKNYLFWTINHFPMINFRLFQTQRVCRQQFQIWWKWEKVSQTGRKHCGKRRNCSLWAISSFPTVFSEDLNCRQIKSRACLGNG